MALTITQISALAELRRYGSLRPTNQAFSPWDGRRTFARRTLQALVDAGHAEWRLGVRGTRNGPVTYEAFVTPVASCGWVNPWKDSGDRGLASRDHWAECPTCSNPS